MNEGVGEKASTALEVVCRFRLEGDDLDGKRKRGREEKFSGTGLGHC